MSETTRRVALITGANKGIGLETARQLGKLGVTILVGARDLEKGEEAAEVLRGSRRGRARAQAGRGERSRPRGGREVH